MKTLLAAALTTAILSTSAFAVPLTTGNGRATPFDLPPLVPPHARAAAPNDLPPLVPPHARAATPNDLPPLVPPHARALGRSL